MAADRRADETRGSAEAHGRLVRLLETERELDAMLEETRRRAAELIDAARARAKASLERFEAGLDAENNALGERIARERDRTIDSIRREAQRETARLNDLDDATIDALARFVVELVVGELQAGGHP
jgi:vacuolar-type H+-ATPase subunit H